MLRHLISTILQRVVNTGNRTGRLVRVERSIVSVVVLEQLAQIDIADVKFDVVEARWVLVDLGGDQSAEAKHVEATVPM